MAGIHWNSNFWLNTWFKTSLPIFNILLMKFHKEPISPDFYMKKEWMAGIEHQFCGIKNCTIYKEKWNH